MSSKPPVDPAVVAALQAAVLADPKSVPLRLHFASVLLDGGHHPEALVQYVEVLAADPSQGEALRGAVTAAEVLGDPRASGWRRLLSALEGAAGAPGAPTAHKEEEEEDGEAEVPRMRVIDGRDRFGWEGDVETPQITLGDVGGMEEVKRRLNLAFLGPLRNPEVRKMYGKSLRGGLLLYGPPGCGKTFIGRATAGELGAHFISVGISDVLDMWLGQSEKKLHELFEAARRKAPTVLFFDEVDALGHKRSQMQGHGGRNVVNALLSELDGVGADNEGVFVLAATNHPWDVDAALRRPGRFDRMVLVLPPDEAARKAILLHHLKERPAESVDVDWVAAKTREFSGADLAHLCESAVELVMEESLTTGTTRPLATADFQKAMKDVRPSIRPWFDVARNYAMFSNEGGMYDDLVEYIKAHKY